MFLMFFFDSIYQNENKFRDFERKFSNRADICKMRLKKAEKVLIIRLRKEFFEKLASKIT